MMLPSETLSIAGAYQRTAWFYPAPTTEPHRLAIFLDAEHYLRDLDAAPIISGLQERGDVPPLSLVFVSQVNSRSRHVDYVCNERYADFIAREVVEWARSQCPLQEADHLISGLSLSGLQAAFTTCRHPGVFSRALCQSGSFWWLAGKDIPFAPTTARFWLSVGDEETATHVSHPPTGLYQEISQIAGVDAAAQRLQELGGAVKSHLYAGGHAAAPWAKELEPALRWLFSESDN
jgi:enterochelin esterase family protein